jgi:hypothetical protein
VTERTTGGLWGTGPRWWRRLVGPLAWLLLLAFTVGYVSYEQGESDKRWCRLLSVLTTDVPPPTTERAKEIANILAAMKSDLGEEVQSPRGRVRTR